MSKKKYLFLILIINSAFVFSQTIDYRLTKDTVLESYNDVPTKFTKGTVLKCNKNELKFYVSYLDTEKYKLLISPLYTENHDCLVSYDYELELVNNIKVFENTFIDLLPVYYLDVLKNKNPSLIYEYQPSWNTYRKKYKAIENESFEVGFWPETIQIGNLYMSFTSENHYLWEKAGKDGNFYKIDLIKQKDYYEDTVPMPECFVKNAVKKEIYIVLKFDGDYVDLWINNPAEENYIGKYFLDIERKSLWEIKMLIKTGNCDLSKVYWPRHADGSSDYDNKIIPPMIKLSTPENNDSLNIVTSTKISTNVAKNKVMSVKENLKLRSAEATSSNVLTVMSAGTKVKIIELGKEETIDGINSNWVKVEVISGRDRDGKDIKKKMTGWCYGGYLE